MNKLFVSSKSENLLRARTPSKESIPCSKGIESRSTVTLGRDREGKIESQISSCQAVATPVNKNNFVLEAPTKFHTFKFEPWSLTYRLVRGQM